MRLIYFLVFAAPPAAASGRGFLNRVRADESVYPAKVARLLI